MLHKSLEMENYGKTNKYTTFKVKYLSFCPIDVKFGKNDYPQEMTLLEDQLEWIKIPNGKTLAILFPIMNFVTIE